MQGWWRAQTIHAFQRLAFRIYSVYWPASKTVKVARGHFQASDLDRLRGSQAMRVSAFLTIDTFWLTVFMHTPASQLQCLLNFSVPNKWITCNLLEVLIKLMMVMVMVVMMMMKNLVSTVRNGKFITFWGKIHIICIWFLCNCESISRFNLNSEVLDIS